MNPDEYVPIHRFQADKLKVAGSVATSKVVLMDAKFSEWSDVIHDQLVHQIEGFVLANCPREIRWTVTYPASWWQAFKKDVLASLTRNSVTSFAKRWHDFFTSPKLAVKEFRETVYANVCPHSPVDASSHHLEWLSVDRDLY